MNKLPAKREWDEFGFKVPESLCSDEITSSGKLDPQESIAIHLHEIAKAKPIGRPPIDGARATTVFSWRVTASRKLAYQTAAGSVPVVRWAFKLLDVASGYKQDKKGKI